jgi:hypothetical protein
VEAREELMDEPSRHLTPNVPYLGHRGPAPEETVAWVEVSVAAPCPRCGAVAGCSVAPNGEFVRCRLIPSRYPVAGGGWLHRLPAGRG